MIESGAKLNILKAIGYYLLAVLLSIAVYKVIILIHYQTFPVFYATANEIIEGKPHWLAFQNRLLGPHLLIGLSDYGFNPSQALSFYFFIMILLQHLILLYLLVKFNISYRTAANYLFVFALTFLCFQNFWLYTWDLIDLIIFTLFAWGIFSGCSIWFLVIIFLIELLNKESAVFISFFIILDAFLIRPSTDLPKPTLLGRLRSLPQLIIGSLLTIFGIIYTKFIRDYLYICAPNGTKDLHHQLFGNHNNLVNNIKDLLGHNLFSLDIINSVFFIGAICCLCWFFKRYSDRQLKALLIFLALSLGILFSGTINESRIYFVLLPFLLFFSIEINKLKTQSKAQKMSEAITESSASAPKTIKFKDTYLE